MIFIQNIFGCKFIQWYYSNPVEEFTVHSAESQIVRQLEMASNQTNNVVTNEVLYYPFS